MRGDWVEHEHPRDRLGQFAEKPGGDLWQRVAAGTARPTVRDSLNSARNTREIAQVTAAEIEKIRANNPASPGRDSPTPVIDFEGQSPQVAREHAEGVLRGFALFPWVKLHRITSFRGATGEDATTFAHVEAEYYTGGGWSSAMRFNRAWAGNRTRYLGALETSSDRKFSIEFAKGNPMSTAIHEFGHALDFTLDTASTDSKKHVQERVQELRDGGRPGASVYTAVSEISHYAYTNHYELAAEAFADVMINGHNAAPLSRRIYNDLAERYREAYEPD